MINKYIYNFIIYKCLFEIRLSIYFTNIVFALDKFKLDAQTCLYASALPSFTNTALSAVLQFSQLNTNWPVAVGGKVNKNKTKTCNHMCSTIYKYLYYCITIAF